jgi:hypothetical protein
MILIQDIESYFDSDPEAEAIIPEFKGSVCGENCPKDLKFNGGKPVLICEKYGTILGRSDNVFLNRCERCIEKNGR